jgi:hypothetical protein
VSEGGYTSTRQYVAIWNLSPFAPTVPPYPLPAPALMNR